MTESPSWKMLPRVPSAGMREAGRTAARAYMADTGGNSLDVIWQAMWDQAPSASRNSANELLAVVSNLALHTGSNIEQLICWLAKEGGLEQMFEAHIVQPNDSTRLHFLLELVTGGPRADVHTRAVSAAVLSGKTGMAIVDTAMRIAQAAMAPHHPGYLIQLSPEEPVSYLGARSDDDEQRGNAPPRTRDVRQAVWYAERAHAEQVMERAIRHWPKVEFRVVDLPVTGEGAAC